MRILLIGGSGQIGSEMIGLQNQQLEVFSPSSKEVNLNEPESLNSAISKYIPDQIIVTAAYHDVGACELNPQIADQVNHLGPAHLANVAAARGIRVAYFSTDYVYSGTLNIDESYDEDDPAEPLSFYGRSKLAGEQAILSASEENLVLRVAGLFGPYDSRIKGENFLNKILRLSNEGANLEIVDDVYFSPTFTKTAAMNCLSLIDLGEAGIFNVANEGSATWFELADYSLRKIGASNLARPSYDQIDPLRPKNTALNISKLENLLPNQLSWRSAVDQYLEGV